MGARNGRSVAFITALIVSTGRPGPGVCSQVPRGEPELCRRPPKTPPGDACGLRREARTGSEPSERGLQRAGQRVKSGRRRGPRAQRPTGKSMGAGGGGVQPSFLNTGQEPVCRWVATTFMCSSGVSPGGRAHAAQCPFGCATSPSAHPESSGCSILKGRGHRCPRSHTRPTRTAFVDRDGVRLHGPRQPADLLDRRRRWCAVRVRSRSGQRMRCGRAGDFAAPLSAWRVVRHGVCKAERGAGHSRSVAHGGGDWRLLWLEIRCRRHRGLYFYVHAPMHACARVHVRACACAHGCTRLRVCVYGVSHARSGCGRG